MKKEHFNELVEYRLQAVKDTLLKKGDEYIRNNDPLHNFNAGSNISGESPEKVLDGFLLKHYISYRDMLRDIEEEKSFTMEYVREKFGDIITYFILQEIQFIDRVKMEKLINKLIEENRVKKGVSYSVSTSLDFDSSK